MTNNHCKCCDYYISPIEMSLGLSEGSDDYVANVGWDSSNQNKPPSFEELKREVSRLNNLLNQNETGMFTWHETIHKSMIKIKELYFGRSQKNTTMSKIIRTPEEVDRVMQWATVVAKTTGLSQFRSHFRGLTYEEGVRDMYDWLVGNYETAPDNTIVGGKRRQ